MHFIICNLYLNNFLKKMIKENNTLEEDKINLRFIKLLIFELMLLFSYSEVFGRKLAGEVVFI